MVASAPKILLVRLKSIGDIVFTAPATDRLRQNHPDASIGFLTSVENRPVVETFPAVNEVLVLDRRLLRRPNLLATSRHLLGLVRRLRARRFSLVIDFQGYGETALLTRLTGAPTRWGCATRPLRRRAYTHNVPRPGGCHPADGYLQMLDQAGVPPAPVRNELRLPDHAMHEAQSFFMHSRLNPAKPTLFLQPFTSAEAKNWPLANFLALAKIWRHHGGQVLFGGGPNERDRLRPAKSAGFAVAAGVPLQTSAALACLATILVGGDTGLLHFVVALGQRTLALMPAERPGSSIPYRHPEWVVSPPPGRPVSEIPVAAVGKALAEIQMP